ncbi:MAG: hypothetical protein LC790_02280 [Actinobacteria bacterium]|nr:hypothetical protein [Actinomycetota bacterium]
MVSKPQFAGLCLTGLLAGNELGTLIGFHPAIRALPLRSQIESERALTGRLGRIMPFYMFGSLVAAGAAAADRRGRPYAWERRKNGEEIARVHGRQRPAADTRRG